MKLCRKKQFTVRTLTALANSSCASAASCTGATCCNEISLSLFYLFFSLSLSLSLSEEDVKRRTNLQPVVLTNKYMDCQWNVILCSHAILDNTG